MSLSPAERSLRGQLAVHQSWANTPDRPARTRKAREAFNKKFEDEVDPDRELLPAERAKRAENARKAYFARLSFESAKARRRRAEGAD